ncbi:hypothetical protein [Microbacterium thalli]|uniref:Uncharacterized protein n=1 Tax=Microbacterium thalli TaxID=3027921 RepID=A0ABT5SEE6_9MICO|nr:hypothetical protein [Microbacterium thalli]MDD7961114.1 hypothetical protein [Microbacterium thalli]
MGMKTRRFIATFGTSVLLLGVLSSAPAYAAPLTATGAPAIENEGQSEPVGAGLPCTEAIPLAAEDADLEAAGYSFVCVDGQGAIASPANEISPERRAQADAEREALESQTSLQRTPANNVCTINKYNRWINNDLNDEFEMCVYYGQKYPTWEWYDSFRVTGSTFLGWGQHMGSFYVDGMYGGPNATLSFDVSLYKGRFGQIPSEVWYRSYSTILPGTLRDDFNYINTGTSMTGTYHTRFHRMRIVAPIYDFDMNVDSYHAGFRFVCNESDPPAWDQCRWPDGEEAF